jgi:DNA-binding GntR family transcriptional regulator
MARPVKFTSVAAQIQARIDAGAFVPGESLPVEQALAEQFGVNRLTLRIPRRRGSCGWILNW